jgi:hypothetical protein
MPLLLDLPAELVARIVQATTEVSGGEWRYDEQGNQLPRHGDVKNLRLTCKQLATIGVSLFETAILYPDQDSARRCKYQHMSFDEPFSKMSSTNCGRLSARSEVSLGSCFLEILAESSWTGRNLCS